MEDESLRESNKTLNGKVMQTNFVVDTLDKFQKSEVSEIEKAIKKDGKYL